MNLFRAVFQLPRAFPRYHTLLSILHLLWEELRKIRILRYLLISGHSAKIAAPTIKSSSLTQILLEYIAYVTCLKVEGREMIQNG